MSTIISLFTDAIGRVDNHTIDIVQLITSADALNQAGEQGLALTLYKYWLAKNPQHPVRHVPAFNLGCIYMGTPEPQQAVDWFQYAVDASPDFYPAYLNLASAYERIGDKTTALQPLRKALERLSAISAQNLSYKLQALRNLGRLADNDALKEAVELDESQSELLQHWVNRRQSSCQWPVIEPFANLSRQQIVQRLAPLTMASHIDDPLLQLAAARRYSRQMEKRKPPFRVLGQWPVPAARQTEKLRIGYLSSDFCHHAVGYLMSDVFEHHDRTRYEITVFNIGPIEAEGIQKKIRAQVDRWFELTGVPDRQAAALIVREGCDILIDMNGHTNHQRTGILALKPAPVIANWLGYPGTMGSDYHHYIIADDFIIPPELERYYSERVLRLPCYQPNGHLFQLPPPKETREQLGLPEGAVVFCCFNGSVKISEPVFSLWMEILRQVPNSVLWLRGKSEDELAARLRTEAVKRGVAGDRLVFLSFRANTEYLSCHAYADLFLDTFPYGAHTTASDALRMGVPIVTLAGNSFASRVCGSLSRAAGLPDLVCASPADYVAQAVRLGNSAEQLAATKQKLRDALPTCTLFDSGKLVRNLEQLFERMEREYRERGLPQLPCHTCDPDDVEPVVVADDRSYFLSHQAYQDRREA